MEKSYCMEFKQDWGTGAAWRKKNRSRSHSKKNSRAGAAKNMRLLEDKKHKVIVKEIMVELQTFTTSNYFSEKIERKIWKTLFHSFEISKKNIFSKFSARALISQNDSLDVLLLVDLVFLVI